MGADSASTVQAWQGRWRGSPLALGAERSAVEQACKGRGGAELYRMGGVGLSCSAGSGRLYKGNTVGVVGRSVHGVREACVGLGRADPGERQNSRSWVRHVKHVHASAQA